MGVEPSGSPSSPSSSQGGNPAVEYGTVAYYEAQRKGNEPLLNENKKQTRSLQTIESLTRLQVQQPTQRFKVIF